jgi:hypothetical protein
MSPSFYKLKNGDGPFCHLVTKNRPHFQFGIKKTSPVKEQAAAIRLS